MPDLITHIALGHLVRRPLDIQHEKRPTMPFRLIFYFGTVLPDILTRPWYIIFPETYEWTLPFHTPLGMLLTCILISLLFAPSLRRRVFINLTAGAFFHFVLDSFQKTLTGNDYWLFPFSWRSYGLGIAWADEVMDLLPVWIGLALLMEGSVIFWNKKISKRM